MLFLSQSEKEKTHDIYMIWKTLIECLIPTFLQVISLQSLVQSIMAAIGVYTPGVESRDGLNVRDRMRWQLNSLEVSYNVHVISVRSQSFYLSM